MELLDRLLRRFGYKPTPTYAFEIDEGVIPKLEEIAAHEDRALDDVAATLLGQAVDSYVFDREKVRRWGTLTERERQVAALTCLGYSNFEVGEKLAIAIPTVKTHLRSIYKKLGVNSRSRLRMIYDWDFAEWE